VFEGKDCMKTTEGGNIQNTVCYHSTNTRTKQGLVVSIWNCRQSKRSDR
jgi:hypothetical protein